MMAGPARAQQRRVVRLTGAVGPANAIQFLDRLAAFEHGLVGLRVRMRGAVGGPGSRRYSAGPYEGGRLLVHAARADQTGWELLIPLGRFGWDHGDYLVAGFFVVMRVGPHQGVHSLSLRAVDDGAVLLLAEVRDEDVGG